MHHRFPRVLVLSLALCAACSSTPRASTSPQPSNDEWIEPSPVLEAEIENHAALIPYLQQMEDFTREVAWFVGVGEPGYPKLFELARASDDKVAGFALAVLAARGDARVVPHLEQIPWPSADQKKLRFERARCHVKLGDWKPMGILVDGLDDADLWSRAQCYKALHQETKQSFDYHPRLEGEARAASVARWREWLAGRNLDPVLN